VSPSLPWAYLWFLALPVVCFVLGWVLICRKRPGLIRLGCIFAYFSAAFFVLLILWIGVMVLLAGWAGSILFAPDQNSPLKEKLFSAGLATILLWIGKKILATNNFRLIPWSLKTIIHISLKKRIPATQPSDNKKDELAYRAFYEDKFSSANVSAIDGWGMKASYRRIILINRL
jgi:hypothetical protein